MRPTIPQIRERIRRSMQEKPAIEWALWFALALMSGVSSLTASHAEPGERLTGCAWLVVAAVVLIVGLVQTYRPRALPSVHWLSGVAMVAMLFALACQVFLLARSIGG